MGTEDVVNDVFARLSAGELAPSADPHQDGWAAELPSGKTVTRSMLEEQAAPLIALGPAAVPFLLRWARNENRALRYVATFGIEAIGKPPHG